jgi:hypothetical protein
VTNIRDYAFRNCTGLTSITIKVITPLSASASAFSSLNKSIPVYVPAESVDAYKAAEVWKNFPNIQAI